MQVAEVVDVTKELLVLVVLVAVVLERIAQQLELLELLIQAVAVAVAEVQTEQHLVMVVQEVQALLLFAIYQEAKKVQGGLLLLQGAIIIIPLTVAEHTLPNRKNNESFCKSTRRKSNASHYCGI
jgi:hypothetical protein